MLFLENVNHYYGYVLNPMLMVGGVIRSLLGPLLFLFYFIYCLPITLIPYVCIIH